LSSGRTRLPFAPGLDPAFVQHDRSADQVSLLRGPLRPAGEICGLASLPAFSEVPAHVLK
jgi:hypothetical protein